MTRHYKTFSNAHNIIRAKNIYGNYLQVFELSSAAVNVDKLESD